MDYLYYLFVLLGFLAVALFLEGAYLAWNAYRGPEAKRIARRLHAMSAGQGTEQISIVKKRLLAQTPALDRLLLQLPRVHQVDRLVLQSGVRLNVASFLGLTLAGGVAGLILSWLLHLPAWIAIVVVVAVAGLPTFYVYAAKARRLHTIEAQLPDALDLMGRAMRAGHAFAGSLKMVGDEMPEPIASEFRLTFDEINYGIPLQDALTNLATRVPSTDLRYFVIAVLIQRETGGNLAELLDNISALIRARLKLLGTIRVLSAEGRLSAWILTVLPFVLAAVINLINPDFMALLWKDPTGLKLVGAALALMIVGILWMWRTIRIRV
ncbi:MAG: type II secretion system F family protein [Gammaproteobacteria bacterium]|nr:type II secretion system F family protein [Gammaproteobacteria bacterium]MBU1406536.1 type II secretion system F family protein [Gammaproteobacteria bacterium]MBU1530844.1 type II secretion system F family protein [Gammaproteobacteria bacterium]